MWLSQGLVAESVNINFTESLSSKKTKINFITEMTSAIEHQILLYSTRVMMRKYVNKLLSYLDLFCSY